MCGQLQQRRTIYGLDRCMRFILKRKIVRCMFPLRAVAGTGG